MQAIYVNTLLNVDYDKDNWESYNQLEAISEQTQNEGQERALETSTLDTV